ncbi:hypothetical protein [Halapricum desulfuricans]|uniref:Signal transduction histidine kinase n=1 Tax=Halapricum desulfuricans TaxID=2841257 RepID=A0A897N8Y7_9EURY|nr:hypothetical protein [Halapricum desulfuricans]QSG07613.1 Signal transduction histidine kinase [Halapricum desulfuricans]
MGTSEGELEDALIGVADILDSQADFQAKTEEALELGADGLGVEHAHLTRIVPELGYWGVIASTDPSDGAFPVGATADLQETFCRRTIDRDDTVALYDAPNQGWADDPAYETHGVSYP